LATPSQGQTYTILRYFAGSDGQHPFGGLVQDPAGNLYGTTASRSDGYYGGVFKIDVSGTLTTLHAFTAAEGERPMESLLYDPSGNLYGNAIAGGANNCPGGCGSIFEVGTTGTFAVKHLFTGTDGSQPVGSLIRDTASNLYGTTQTGGAYGAGTIFKLDPSGVLTTLYSFTGGADGGSPKAGLVADPSGNLYGTTFSGGASHRGTVFKFDTLGIETVLYSFAGGTDGSNPSAGLTIGKTGVLYGTTLRGGAADLGTIFKLDLKAKETILHIFRGYNGARGDDGASPVGTLLLDAFGNLYGVTEFGSPSNNGIVFRLGSHGNLQILHEFEGGSDGSHPQGALMRDSSGNIYGTMPYGGMRNEGILFEISF
jgi:uncharacterized repeat protein (TIGR03803 family)